MHEQASFYERKMFSVMAWEKRHIGNYWNPFQKKIPEAHSKLRVASALFIEISS